ncbi:S49 family peptidase [Indioceanicola profundi]|uniref:S49 family peptidase n=1 Tax=Indioceanicola profundi TaxID=2220096 RepID=UPI00298DDE1A|nr:S49 family peptidase [Indioceanicola profundi]
MPPDDRIWQGGQAATIYICMMMRRFRRLFGLENPPVVSLIRLSGVIAAGGGPLRQGGLNIAGTAPLLERAFAPAGLAAVAIVINSPGGSPVQSALIGKRIRALAEEKRVPVIAFVEDVAASGGYWIACAADEIVADPSSVVGSIGVISASFGFTEAIRKLGVERRVYTAGENKSILDPFQPEKEEDVARLKSLQLEIHDAFKQWVGQRRAGKLNGDAAELFSGAFWTGAKGLELGLVDRLGDARTVLRERFGNKVVIRGIGQKKSLFSRLRFSVVAPEIGSDLLSDLPSGLMTAMEDRAMWARYGL